MRVLSHELRNLVATMRNSAHLIRLRSPSDAAIVTAAQAIERQIGAMLKLLERIVDADRIERGDVAIESGRVDVHAAILGALEENRKAIEARAQRVEVSGDGLFARSDEPRLRQVLSRLVLNASRFSPQGAAIGIRAEERQGSIHVHVRDNGAGMPVGLLPRVFVFFAAPQQKDFTATATRGLGIGLPAMHALTRLLGGDLTVSSDGPGKGCEFVVALPAWHGEGAGTQDTRPAESSPTDATQARDAEAPGRARRILLVDDSAAIRDSFSDLLHDMGYEVRSAGDGEAALRMAADWRPEYVFLDINLPGLDGYEVARRLRAQFSSDELKLVMISGVTLDAATVRDAKRAGFDFCFDKAGSFATLDAWIRQQQAP